MAHKIGFIILISLLSFGKLAAQDEQRNDPDTVNHWKFTATNTLLFNQVAVSNWSAGGDNALSLAMTSNMTLAYQKDRSTWSNKFDASYGLTAIEGQKPRKRSEFLQFGTNNEYSVARNLNAAVFGDLLTQFASGFDYKNDPEAERYTSGFFAPAYSLQGVGLDYKNDSIGVSALLSPASSKQTWVLDRGVKEQDYGLDSGATVRWELGAYFRLNVKRTLWKNTIVQSDLLLFSNYLDHPENVDVNWQTRLDVMVNKYVKISLLVHLIYDNDLKFIDLQKTQGGDTVITGQGPRTQFRQVLGIGLTYQI